LHAIHERELLANLRSGNKLNESINRLYLLYFDCLSGYVLHNHGNRQDAEDIFQEVVIHFISILKKDKFREACRIKTFLFSLTRHVWLNELKKRGVTHLRERKYSISQETVESGIPERVEKKWIRQQLTELLDRIGQPCKEILQLYYYDNLSLKEIMGCLDFENEQVLKKIKCGCEKQLNQIINKDPLLKRDFKEHFVEEKSMAID
jgi:RNA polymerase sigma factor (sigma-70 family)